MYVTIINGSENADGSTRAVADWLLDQYKAEHAFGGEVISLAEHSIAGCGTCGQCNTRSDPCEVDDDVRSIISRMLRANVIVYAAPVHGFGTAAVMQRFVERAGVGYLRFTRPLANKVGGIVVVGRRYSHESVLSQLQMNLLLNRMILPGSGYPVVFRSADYPNFRDDREAVSSARAMVTRTAEVAGLLTTAGADTSLGVNERHLG